MRSFDFYEFVGYLAPGMLLLFGLGFLWPDHARAFLAHDLSIGGFGVGVIVAYAAGQLVQAIGNGIEKVWWKLRGGMPTDWVRSGKHALLAEAQRSQVDRRIRPMLRDDAIELSSLGDRQWYAVTRQVYAAVAAAGRAGRVDVFNGNYGLCRGIAAALLVILIAATIVDWQSWRPELLVAGLFLLAVYRMQRFGVHYARELFVQFLQLPEGGGKAGGA